MRISDWSSDVCSSDLVWGSGFDAWSAALEDACKRLAAYAPEVLVVSLGVDTFEKDPISQFKLKSPDYLRIGESLARLGKPTLFVMVGGYAVAEIGVHPVHVLTGSSDERRVWKSGVRPVISGGWS